jgi:hypothetical protein
MECDTEQPSTDTRWDRDSVGAGESIEERWRVTLARQRQRDSAASEFWIESEVIALNAWWKSRPVPKEHNIESEFQALAKTWRTETEHLSSVARKIAHPSYLEIIRLGSSYPTKVVPLILKELRKHPGFWFAALETVTGERPCNDHSDPNKERLIWLKWGKSRGYL